MGFLALAAQAQIVPDGTTATQVRIGGGGVVELTPARPVHDVSYNAFRQFDVHAAGAVVRNTDVRARTIVAEVFSPTPIRIHGPVTLEGPRANFILANQNGIQVNGGQFTNFGSLALTTGAVSLRDVALTADRTQRYVDLSTQGGRIDVGPAGLSADLIRLELVAKTIGLDGPVTNLFSSPTASTRLVVGSSAASFDTLASPTDNLTPWMRYEAGQASVNGTALGIAAASGISAGRIEIIVTDRGAGVNHAGDLAATHGDLVLSATGDLVQRGASLQAAGRVQVEAASLNQGTREGRASTIAAGTQLSVRTTGAVHSQGGVLSGVGNDSASGAPAVSLVAGGAITLQTAPGESTALVHASAGDVAIESGAGIQASNSRIVSNGALDIRATGAVQLSTAFEPGAGRAQTGSGGWLRRRVAWSVDHGRLLDDSQQGYWVAAGDLRIQGRELLNEGASIFSNAGGVHIAVTGQVLNQARVVGQAEFQRSCVLFVCKTRVISTERAAGGEISAATDLQIQAGERIVNAGGSVLALGSLRLQAPQTVARGVTLHQAITRDQGMKSWLGHRWGALYAFDQGGGFAARNGRLELLGHGVQEGGFFSGEGASTAPIDVVRPPTREPVRLSDHLGILRW